MNFITALIICLCVQNQLLFLDKTNWVINGHFLCRVLMHNLSLPVYCDCMNCSIETRPVYALKSTNCHWNVISVSGIVIVKGILVSTCLRHWWLMSTKVTAFPLKHCNIFLAGCMGLISGDILTLHQNIGLTLFGTGLNIYVKWWGVFATTPF